VVYFQQNILENTCHWEKAAVEGNGMEWRFCVYDSENRAVTRATPAQFGLQLCNTASIGGVQTPQIAETIRRMAQSGQVKVGVSSKKSDLPMPSEQEDNLVIFESFAPQSTPICLEWSRHPSRRNR